MSCELLEEPIMARETGIKTKTVRLPAELVEALKIIAMAKSMKEESFNVPVYLAGMVREQIMRDRAEAMAFIKKQK